MTEPLAGSAMPPAPHGPFRSGDPVQLTDPKGRVNTITLQPGKLYHSHKGALPHDEIIGSPEGSASAVRITTGDNKSRSLVALCAAWTRRTMDPKNTGFLFAAITPSV
jgi:tRNA A58 N-methylase Trm61